MINSVCVTLHSTIANPDALVLVDVETNLVHFRNLSEDHLGVVRGLARYLYYKIRFLICAMCRRRSIRHRLAFH